MEMKCISIPKALWRRLKILSLAIDQNMYETVEHGTMLLEEKYSITPEETDNV